VHGRQHRPGSGPRGGLRLPRAAAGALLFALALVGCSDDFDFAASERHAPDEAVGLERLRLSDEMPQAGPPPASAQPGEVTPAVPQRLIRTGHMTVEVERIEPAVERIQALAASLDGYVAHVSMQTGADQFRRATLTLRIPAERFDEATAGVRPLGKVERLDVSVEDVTEQYVDLEARLANARRLEERLLQLLETRTGTLEQVLAAERELARVRTEIELYDGRLRQLAGRVSLSTLTVVVQEPRPILGTTPGQSVLGNAFRQAWRNFVWTVAGIISAAGALIPLLLLLAVLAWPAARWLRRRRRGAP
jgi:hypothetical protein